MKALVTGFHMLYRLSPDSKYPWSGENTGPIEIPVLNVPLLGSGRSDSLGVPAVDCRIFSLESIVRGV